MNSLFWQYTLAGVSQGSMYAVVAIGFVIIYKTTGIINFAQGEFVMLGGLLSVVFYNFMPLLPAIVLAALLVAVLSGLIEYLFLRRFRNIQVIKMVLITIGISILLREVALHTWGEKVFSLPYFTGDQESAVKIFNAYISPQKVLMISFALAAISILIIFFNKTRTGRAMRACAANVTAARLCGIPAGYMLTVCFIISAFLAALAGSFMAPLSILTYDCGAALSIKAFAAAALSGLDNIAGAVAGALFLGIIEAYSIIWLPSSYTDIISLLVLIIILIIKPQGVFTGKALQYLKEY
ncbi:MAG TPA: branched-chain amino acid ABC transporter permease [Spirochaetota bacterium]|nr:branched-chain amino acid ABC transporter permease [Spirochaetota bacterium]